MSADVRH